MWSLIWRANSLVGLMIRALMLLNSLSSFMSLLISKSIIAIPKHKVFPWPVFAAMTISTWAFKNSKLYAWTSVGFKKLFATRDSASSSVISYFIQFFIASFLDIPPVNPCFYRTDDVFNCSYIMLSSEDSIPLILVKYYYISMMEIIYLFIISNIYSTT